MVALSSDEMIWIATRVLSCNVTEMCAAPHDTLILHLNTIGLHSSLAKIETLFEMSCDFT